MMQIWKRYSGPIITILQVAADFFAVFAAFWVGYYSYINFFIGLAPQSASQYLWLAGGAALLFVTIFRTLDLYNREISLLNIEELRKLFIATVWASFFFFGITFYLRSVNFSRVTITISLIASFVFLYIERLLFYRIHLMFHLKGLSSKRILIYGAGEVGKHLLKRIYHSPALGLAPVGFVDDDEQKLGQRVLFREFPGAVGNSVVGRFEDLDRLVKSMSVEEVFIAIPSASYESSLKIVRACQKIGVRFSIVPHAYELLIEKIQFFEIGGIPIMRMRQMRRPFYYQVAKRLIDFAVSLVLLTVLLPMFLAIGLLVMLDSKGPIIFKQKRVGYRGKEFSFYKFRTMYTDAPAYGLTPNTSDDPRITPMGKWLRRTSLDELPQLFNVFRGDMSLVGPRPEMPFIVKTYNQLQKERLAVKPGITGVWQISAVRGDPIHMNIEYDLYYIENQSLLLDFVILIKTVFGVIRGVGAI